MRRILEGSLRFRVLVAVVAVGVLATGFLQLPETPVDVYPEFAPPFVEVQTEALGLSAAEVEQMITVPLEADLLNGVAWLRDIRSESVPGMSSITLVFENGTDLYRARQLVQERLSQAAALPNVSKPPQMLQPVSSTSRTMMIGLSSPSLSLIEISQLARWVIKPRLMGVDGVANVASFGQRERQLQVRVDPARLQASKVSLLDVVRTTGNALVVSPLSFLEASTPGTGGFIDGPNQRLGVRHISPIVSAGDLAQVVIERQIPAEPTLLVDRFGRVFEQPAPPALRIGDVAAVVEDHQPLIGDALVDDAPGLVLVVEKLPGANTVEVTKGVEAALAALRPGLQGLTVDTSIFRPAEFIAASERAVSTGILVGLVLLVGLLALAFRDWRSTVVATVAVLVAIGACVLVLAARGATLNLMVVAGLALALVAVVDDAVTATERAARRRRDAPEGTPAAATALAAALEVRGTLVYATFLVALPVVPLFFMDGLLGAFGRPLAITYGLALAASMATAFVVTPGMTLLLKPRLAPRPTRGIGAALCRRYEGLLRRTLSSTAPVLGVVGVLAVVGLLATPYLGGSSLAALEERDYVVELETPAGTSLPEMNRLVTEVSRQLRALPAVRNVAAHVGRAVTGDTVVDVNSSELWVSLDANADQPAAVRAMRKIVADIPGVVDRDVLSYQHEGIKEAMSSADEPLVVRVYGQDLAILSAKAEEVATELRKIDGVSRLAVETPVQEPILEIEVDLEKARVAGVKPGDVRRAAAVLLSGVDVGQLFYDQKVFDVVVWGTPETRRNADDVRNLRIDTPSGAQVRLADVAAVRDATSPDVIEREGAFRRIDLTVSAAKADRARVATTIESRLDTMDFPLEYRAELLGGYAERAAAQRRLLALGGLAVVGMVLLLQACFGNWRLGLAFSVALPLAVVGGLVAAATENPVSLGAVAGLLPVMALAARSGMLLVRRAQQLVRIEGERFGTDVVVRAGRERLLPTLASAAATAGVFLPFLGLAGRPGVEILGPMALVVVAGMVTAVPFTLLVVPRIVLRFGAVESGTELDVRRFEEELAATPAAGAPPPGPPLPLAPVGSDS